MWQKLGAFLNATLIFKQDSKEMKTPISCMGHIDAINIKLCVQSLDRILSHIIPLVKLVNP
jgi:hypothetical protein